MKILSAYKMSLGVYYVVFETAYAGAPVHSAVLEMDETEFEQFNVKLFNTSQEAYAYGYDCAFGDGAYTNDYERSGESECEYGTLHQDGDICHCGEF